MSDAFWRFSSKLEPGPLHLIESQLAAEADRLGVLPLLRSDQQLFVTSDYSGMHKQAAFRTYSFLLVPSLPWKDWDERRRQLREDSGVSRRMSYKTLGDFQRYRIFRSFLQLAKDLPSWCITVAVDKRRGPLFGEPRDGSIDRELRDGWKQGSRESMLRITHFLALILSGVTSDRQNILWISDEDEIVANDARLAIVAKALAYSTSNLVSHDLGHLRVGSTKSDPGDLSLEDLTSIPDLVAGAVSDLLTHAPRRAAGLFAPAPPALRFKGRAILAELFRDGFPMRTTVLTVEGARGSSLPARVATQRILVDV